MPSSARSILFHWRSTFRSSSRYVRRPESRPQPDVAVTGRRRPSASIRPAASAPHGRSCRESWITSKFAVSETPPVWPSQNCGGAPVSRSALATANATRPRETFAGLLAALMAQLERGYRRKIGDCVRLIDSTSVRLSALSGEWATFSAGVCGAKAHVVYDPDADQPLYLMVTPANVNDIVAAK